MYFKRTVTVILILHQPSAMFEQQTVIFAFGCNLIKILNKWKKLKSEYIVSQFLALYYTTSKISWINLWDPKIKKSMQ